MAFDYIKRYYNVPAELYREVIVNCKKGVITSDMGNYIGVNFYDDITYDPKGCHPTWEVEYLETFNYKPPVKKLTASQKRYRQFVNSETGLSFREWLGIS